MADREPTEHAVVTLAARGWGQRRIAKELGIGRKLVRGILRRTRTAREQGHTALPKAPKRRTRGLDAHGSHIQQWLEAFPDITAVRLLEELRKEGFEGGYSAVKDRLRELRPKSKKPFVERFETEPGQQGQQDWSPYKVPFSEQGLLEIQCFSFVLGFSRRQYIHFAEHADLVTFERLHIAAATRFHGFPREVLYDGQKLVVLRREANRPIYNPKFLRFCTHYGFTPVALPPRSPKLKGKVEQPFKYVEGHCLNARRFRTLAELNAHAERWMDETSDLHVHDTTGERPLDRFERERDALIALPSHPYDTAEVGYRVVSDSALVHWDDVRYSVPVTSVLDLVVVRATEHEIVIYKSDLKELARHERARRGHPEPVVNPLHRPTRTVRHDVDGLAARLGELGETAVLFSQGVIRAQRYRGAHLTAVLALVERYDATDLLRALERAVRYRAFDAGAVERILGATAQPRPLPSTEEQRARTRLCEQAQALHVPPRSLDVYTRVFAGDPEP